MPTIDPETAKAAFDVDVAAGAFEIVATDARPDLTIQDVTYTAVDGRTVSAYLVVPESAGPHPAVVFLHWYATDEPDGDRTEFLEEASALAARGVVSLLPQQVFPWEMPPSGITADHQAVIDQVVDLRVGLERLRERPEVDPQRVAIVGHDFGGMYAALIAALDPDVKGCLVMASVPRFADWFIPYWHPVRGLDEDVYRTTMRDVDPVTFVTGIDVPMLLQFGDRDGFVSALHITSWLAAAPAGSTRMERYSTEHPLRLEQARLDREAFLIELLRPGD